MSGQQQINFEKPFIGSIDQGTSSTRFILFDSKGDTVLSHQIPLKQYHPNPGWVEHDGLEIINSVNECISQVLNKYKETNIGEISDIKAIGITNQRETTIVWDKNTGKPYHNAIVWSDTRTSSIVNRFNTKAESLLKKEQQSQSQQQIVPKDYLRDICGLPIANYFSAVKLRWLIENVPEIDQSNALAGTIDSWLVWNLTNKKTHITDVTNASRTMLMNLATLEWDSKLCDFFDVPNSLLPKICSSAEIYGHVESGPLAGVPIASVLGDQQSAMVGQMCFDKGQAKNTYGTGCFLLYNTGDDIVHSKHGLLTTVCYKLGKDSPVHYALEGSIAVAGAGVKWLIENLGFANNSKEIEALANSVQDTGGMYIVPAFSGLFAPHWRDDARGVMVGLTHHTNKAHIARAMLESTCFQTYEVLKSMEKDSNDKLVELRVDGGMTMNDLLLQIQADILGLPVVRPHNLETTCFGAAYAAGLTVGVWSSAMQFHIGKRFTPNPNIDHMKRINDWHKAVSKSVDWVDK
ncbi:Glycerol kinase 2 [Heterostelium album PN500]|uniref:Probable glycerol kinase n=1 Tax=Heterostelium pallidum (strain ATCC 26659 / Pp 5 / PN500) TaxID=670386 RepID=D3BT28_HETP5|nr:Glycerol kinase 2 [Heterostelium album PN500]EFA75245.1 Glycerol kinase 2 [Heterostelium album PN500]|eukprot:XP_020427379.1 Glycerol kinase 2 [Heterostelium album PN500]